MYLATIRFIIYVDWWSWNTEYKHNKNKTWGNLRTTDITHTKGRPSADEVEMFMCSVIQSCPSLCDSGGL